MRPRNLSGDGTVSDAGMWSTSSVVMRGSCRYSLMSLVYSSSIFCGAAAAGAGARLPFFGLPGGGAARGVQVLLDELGVLFVDLLRGRGGGRRRRLAFLGLAGGGAGNESEREQRATECEAE